MRKPLSVKQITKPFKTRVFATEGAVGRKNARIFELRCIFIHFPIPFSVYLCNAVTVCLNAYGEPLPGVFYNAMGWLISFGMSVKTMPQGGM